MKPIRQAKIRELLESEGVLSVAQLVERFEVSEATIRRDLDELAADGAVMRTHGGAMTSGSLGRELPLIEREGEQRDAKHAIAREAAAMVRPGETIFLGSGTTVAAMTKYLQSTTSLTIITNSFPVIDALRQLPAIQLIVIGGQFRQSELSMVGTAAIDLIRQFRPDRVFMGMRGVDVEQGFTGDSLDEAMTDRAILAVGQRSAVLADHTKFGLVSNVFLAPVDTADLVITDDRIDRRLADSLIAAGMQLLIAEG